MPLLDDSYRLITCLYRILKFFCLYQRCCVKNVSPTTRDEMRLWIVFIRLVCYLFAGGDCVRCVMLTDKISAFPIKCHVRLRHAVIWQCFSRNGNILCMGQMPACNDHECCDEKARFHAIHSNNRSVLISRQCDWNLIGGTWFGDRSRDRRLPVRILNSSRKSFSLSELR